MTRALFPAVFALSASILPGCIIASDRTMTFDDIEGIVVQFSNGDVEIDGVTGPVTTVDLDMGGVTFKRVGHDVNDGVLMLALDCGLACGGDVVITAPEGVWIDARMDNGDLSVRDISGDVTATLGAGDLSVSGLTSRSVCLGTGAGSIDAELELPAESLVVDVAAGDATLHVPEGAYVLDLDAGAGSLETVGVWHDPTSDFLISARAGAGSLEVVGW